MVAPRKQADPVIAVQALTKTFKDFWLRARARAVDNVSFEVYPGEIFGLLGPNGSGKSTTIKIMLGLLKQTSGRIAVFGKPPSDVAVKKRIGYLPEESYLYPFLNARETLDYYGKLFKLERGVRQRRTDELLDMVGLSAVQYRPVREYSKGMQRRIGIAQALINDPDLVILDEPTAGLDPLGCREVKDLILALAQRGKTVILSSHLLSDVEDVCDRAVIYYGGRIQAQGPLHQLLAKPDSVRITAPVLSRETTEKVLNLIRAEVGDTVRLENPTQNLESYFLGVVEAARRQAETSGATSGNRVAEYLRGAGDSGAHPGAHTGSHQADSVLERLSRPTESATPIVSEIAAPAQPSTEAVLESLVRHETPAAPAPASKGSTSSPSTALPAKTAAPEPAKPVDLSKANDALSGLLGGGKGGKK
jgi:ABC-2 type transport system ATP-binding protein